MFIIASSGGSNILELLGGIGQVFVFVVTFVAVIILAIVATKFIANTKFKTFSNRNIKVIESVAIGQQSALTLVKLGEKHLLLGVTKERITHLCDVDQDDLILQEQEPYGVNMPFKKYLDKYLHKNNELKGGEGD